MVSTGSDVTLLSAHMEGILLCVLCCCFALVHLITFVNVVIIATYSPVFQLLMGTMLNYNSTHFAQNRGPNKANCKEGNSSRNSPY